MLSNSNENLKNGYINLYRSLVKWGWFTDVNTCHLFIYCLLKANHKNAIWKGNTISAGQFITSLANLSIETGLSIQQVRTALKKLNSTSELTSRGTTQNTVITVNNYKQYQGINTVNNKQITFKQQTDNKQITTNNNDNNDNNDNKYIYDNKEIQKNKKDDPYTGKIQALFCAEYKKVFGKSCFLNNAQRLALVDIDFENPDFKENLPVLIEKFSKIKFNFDGKVQKVGLRWLLEDGNWSGVLSGDFDDNIATDEVTEEKTYNREDGWDL